MEDKQHTDENGESTPEQEQEQAPMNRAERRAAAKGKSLPGERPIPGLRTSGFRPQQPGGSGSGPHQKRGSTPRKSGTG